MKKILLSKSFWLILFDIFLIPFCIFCKHLSDKMLSYEGICIWTLYGGKCLTCGGTHFVNSLLQGDIIEAFQHNELLFIFLLVFIAILVLLHLSWIWKVKFAKKILRLHFFLAIIAIGSVGTLIFWIIRNIPMFLYFLQLGIDYITPMFS